MKLSAHEVMITEEGGREHRLTITTKDGELLTDMLIKYLKDPRVKVAIAESLVAEILGEWQKTEEKLEALENPEPAAVVTELIEEVVPPSKSRFAGDDWRPLGPEGDKEEDKDNESNS